MARRNPGGVTDLDKKLELYDQKVLQLRTATREANEAIQGVREVMREASRYRQEIEDFIQRSVDGRVSDAVAIGLESFKEALDGALESATERTYGRFDQIAELLLGEDRASQRKGLETIPELVMKKVDVKPHQFVPLGPDGPNDPCLDCQDCRYPLGNKVVHPEPTDSPV